MKIIFSPSKSQSVVSYSRFTALGQPVFAHQAQSLESLLLALGREDIQQIFKTSPKKTDEIFEKIHTEKASVAAIDLFTGTSFKYLEIDTYSVAEQEYCDRQLIILSALYGVLRVRDQVSPYRLDMTDKLPLESLNVKNLYDFWSRHITQFFQEEDYIINLASQEYSKLLSTVSGVPMINIHFLVNKDGQQKNISVISKQQRGKMLNYMIRNRIQDPKKICLYSADGFIFSQDMSDENNYFFIKNT